MVHHRLQEGAVVADEEHGGVEPGQIVLQPAGGLEVEVVGGLVEQEHVGGSHQLLRQPEPAPLAAAQPARDWVRAWSGSKPRPCKHRVDPGGQGIAAFALEPLQVAIVAGQHRRRAAVPRLGQRLPCPASDRSSSSSSAKGPAAASHTVAAPANSRCCSISENPKPRARATVPLVGSASPVIRPNSVVLPLPLRPMIPTSRPG